MKFRISQWIDTSNLDVEELPITYGVQINKEDGNGWKNVAKNGKALFFDNPEDADSKIEEIKSVTYVR